MPARERAPSLWVEHGGEGETTWLLLHGLGATGATWAGVARLIEAEGAGRWIAPDLRGHGRSAAAAHYGLGQHSADMAELLRDAGGRVIAVGHSMGGLVALGLATGWFGVEIAAALALGMKVTWSEEEHAGVRKRSAAPVRWLATRDEAVDRFLKVSGLIGVIPPEHPICESGVVAGVGGWRVASDPFAISIGGPPMDKLVQASRAPVALACGERDALVTTGELRQYDPAARMLPGLSHNAHVEDPEAVWAWIKDVTTPMASARA